METNRAGNDYVLDIDNSWNDRSKHLPVSSIVFSSIGKNVFHPAALLESGFWSKLQNTFLQMNELKATLCTCKLK